MSENQTIIAIGTSAGGVEALRGIVSALPADFPAAILITHHQSPQARSMMPAILSRSGPLPVAHACHDQLIEPGHIYLAPPDQHMLIRDGHIILGRGPRENCTRPAIDPLFRTVAKVYGSRAIGVILTGNLDDGTLGLGVIKQCGGVTIVQDPKDSLYPGMPQSAISNVDVDYVLPLSQIAGVLNQLVETGSSDKPSNQCPTPDEQIGEMSDPAEGTNVLSPEELGWGQPSTYACPDCHGTLWESQMPNGLLKFRCRVGHAYTEKSLSAMQGDRIQEALWIALRALEEKIALLGRLSNRSRNLNQTYNVERYDEQKSELDQQATILRGVLERGRSDTQCES